jgi:hypothetical protein
MAMFQKNVAKTVSIALVAVLLASSLAIIGANVAYAKSDKASEIKKAKELQERLREMQEMRFERVKKWFNERRIIFLNKGPNYVNFISTKTEGGDVQSFMLRIHSEGTPSIYAALANYTKEDGNKTLYWVNGMLKVFGLIEYIDVNNDGLYQQKDNDTRLQYVNFARLDWKLTVTRVTAADNIQGWKVEMIANDGDAIYNITTQVYNTGVRLQDGTPVTPYEAKIDFGFKNFPWTSDESRLALITSFEGVSGTASVMHYSDTTEVIVERNAYAYFTWAPSVKVDGEEVEVKVLGREQGRVHFVELNYPHGTEIVHDPIIGVLAGSIEEIPAYQLPTSATPTVPIFSGFYLLTTTVVVLAIVGVILIAARKMIVEPKILKTLH